MPLSLPGSFWKSSRRNNNYPRDITKKGIPGKQAMIANYGYSDGTGEYYIIIDTDKCDGCGECVTACPEGIFEIAPDDYDKMVAQVKEELLKTLSYVCPGYYRKCHAETVNCHQVCQKEAIDHTW